MSVLDLMILFMNKVHSIYIYDLFTYIYSTINWGSSTSTEKKHVYTVSMYYIFQHDFNKRLTIEANIGKM